MGGARLGGLIAGRAEGRAEIEQLRARLDEVLDYFDGFAEPVGMFEDGFTFGMRYAADHIRERVLLMTPSERLEARGGRPI